MTKSEFQKRIVQMKVELSRDIKDQVASRLHQCSFIKRNKDYVDIEFSTRLLDIYIDRLGSQFAQLINNKQHKVSPFLLMSFDEWINNIIQLTN